MNEKRLCSDASWKQYRRSLRSVPLPFSISFLLSNGFQGNSYHKLIRCIERSGHWAFWWCNSARRRTAPFHILAKHAPRHAMLICALVLCNKPIIRFHKSPYRSDTLVPTSPRKTKISIEKGSFFVFEGSTSPRLPDCILGST